MKRLIATLALLAIAATAGAQITHTDNGAVDKNAEQIIAKAAKKMNDGAVSFTVTMVNKDENKKEKERIKAEVLYKNGKYRATLANNVLMSDGTTGWNWNKQDNEVIVNKMTDSEDNLMNPGAILANYKKSFRAKFIRKEADGTAVIDLTPKQTKSYHKIRILVNADTGVLKKLEMHYYDSSSDEFVVSNFKSGVKSSDSDFTFQPSEHPGVEVIDMR